MSSDQSGRGWPPGHDLVEMDEVDSTNAEAARRAPKLSRPTWIAARRQTRGRGRGGRAWHDPPGNFAATLLIFPQELPREVALNSFAACLALEAALRESTGMDAFALKWPNDVLLNGAKIAGILLESAGTAEHTAWLAIGFGVNLRAAPTKVEPGALRPSSLLAELGRAPAPRDLLFPLARHFAHWRETLLRSGFASLREAWLARAARLGEPITARTGKAESTGIFETLDEAGQLVLRSKGGITRIPAADIHF